MIGWAITFLIVALVAAIFGFGGIAGAAVDIAKLIFFVAIVLFAISAVIGLLRGRSPSLQPGRPENENAALGRLLVGIGRVRRRERPAARGLACASPAG